MEAIVGSFRAVSRFKYCYVYFVIHGTLEIPSAFLVTQWLSIRHCFVGYRNTSNAVVTVVIPK
jgi:hypothetical protein